MSNKLITLADIPSPKSNHPDNKKHTPGELAYKDGVYSISFRESEAIPVPNKSGRGYHITVVFEPTERISSRCVNLIVR